MKCPDLLKYDNGSDGRVCWKCKDKGHIAERCPNAGDNKSIIDKRHKYHRYQRLSSESS